MIEERRLDIEADKGFAENVFDGVTKVGFITDDEPWESRVHLGAITAFKFIIIEVVGSGACVYFIVRVSGRGVVAGVRVVKGIPIRHGANGLRQRINIRGCGMKH